ncbi:Spy/CpxP family protein refolding chaperone [Sulfurospirillum sp. 1307]
MKILFLFFIFFSTFVFADYDGRSEYHYRKDLSYLKLSDTQKKEMELILKEYRNDIKDFRKLKYKLIDQKEKLFLKDILDEEKIKDINNKINEYATKIEIKFLRKTHKLLTQHQKEKFEKYIEEWEIE